MTTFTYNFSTVENPISDGGLIIQPATDRWGPMQVAAAGTVEGVGTNPAQGYACCLTSSGIGSDQYSEIVVTATGYPFIGTRMNSTLGQGTGYFIVLDNALGYNGIYRSDTGTGKQEPLLASWSGTTTANDVVRMQSIGSLHSHLQNGVLQNDQVSDATYTGGEPWIGNFTTSRQLASPWNAGDAGALLRIKTNGQMQQLTGGMSG